MAEALTGKAKPLFSNNPVCGAATFVYYDEDSRDIVPVTKLVDVDAFERTAWDVYYTAIRGGVWRQIAKTKALKLLKTVKDKRLKGLLYDLVVKKDYDSLARFMFNVVGIGIMHFMDVYNFDIERIQRCDIHYASPDGRIMPFCTHNNFHREKIEQAYKIDPSVWTKITGKSLTGFA